MSDPPDRPGLAAANIVALVVWGVAFSFWMLRYTDWFPVVGGLLGLTGAFSWVAFLTNIVPEARKKAFQGWFDEAVLQKPWPISALSGLSLAFFALFTTWHGTLIVDTLGDGVPRTVALTRLDDGQAAPLRFGTAARSEKKLLAPTGLLGATEYRLKLSGLPALSVRIAPWQRRTVVSPSDLLSAPVVLLRPTATMSGEASSGEFALLVRANGQEYGRLSDYRGESVWIGAEADVEVPSAAIERWRLELLSRGLATELVQRWTSPRSLANTLPLAAGTVVTATILRDPDVTDPANAGVQGTAEMILKPVTSGAGFPRELVIDVLRNGR